MSRFLVGYKQLALCIVSDEEPAESEKVVITVYDRMGDGVAYTVNRTVRFEKIIAHYCNFNKKVPMSHIRMERGAQQIALTDTVASSGLEDGDFFEIHLLMDPTDNIRLEGSPMSRQA